MLSVFGGIFYIYQFRTKVTKYNIMQLISKLLIKALCTIHEGVVIEENPVSPWYTVTSPGF